MSLLFHPWWQISLRLSIQISIIHGWINSWTESSRAPEKEIYLTRTLLGGTYINSELGHFRNWESQTYYLLQPGAVTSAFMDWYTDRCLLPNCTEYKTKHNAHLWLSVSGALSKSPRNAVIFQSLELRPLLGARCHFAASDQSVHLQIYLFNFVHT